MADERRRPAQKVGPEQCRKVSPWPYLVTGLILAAIPVGGYLYISWRDAERRAEEARRRAIETKRNAAEKCFRRPVLELVGHEGPVTSAVFLPGGKRALSGGADRTLRLWDLESGTEILQLTGHTDVVRSVAVSPDGTRALSGSADGTFRLWKLADGTRVREFGVRHQCPVHSVAISPDGTRALSTEEWQTVRLWDIETGAEIRRFVGSWLWVSSVAFSPDGKQALGGAIEVDTSRPEPVNRDGPPRLRGSLRLLDLEGSREIGSYSWPTSSVGTVSFSPDGRRAVSGGWGVRTPLRLWDFGRGGLVRAFASPEREGLEKRQVNTAAFSPDGRYVLSGGGWCDTASVWHAELLLWRLPDEDGFRLLGTQDEKEQGGGGE